MRYCVVTDCNLVGVLTFSFKIKHPGIRYIYLDKYSSYEKTIFSCLVVIR